MVQLRQLDYWFSKMKQMLSGRADYNHPHYRCKNGQLP